MFIDEIHFDAKGLVPVIAQDAKDGTILMLAWANKEALEETVKTGRGTYFSRSRSKLWRKGEESGNIQKVSEILLDCDCDAVIYKVEQIGGIACHTGHRSCFYKTLKGNAWEENSDVLKSPDVMYANHK
ncbi:phosphoribosyl-AMP cyclohydrolase [Turicimonas muris]|uniref:Phosphoribosyl-AMP cyclohydrolase n=2 Tax=Turicimonas muris TaxID=1796652 RepID=A0A227KIW1_9BURK|nr:phosphoribosyl-AMP cyclohydrolase [Turicimonas muris]ANU67160.1 phosphoribosyl-AMP cyclohydrolase [Burkholderiales bacterium YL45]MBS4769048.1 phosphoribosyl-AMP cyclohydrolase [Burkholderiales bacterium]MBS4846641.1 phosphoribosyl-AMP cyclohydrolase [Burkholderiales bacterium]OXE47785.1 phosphoribosyl-AMP cyclohydrolase [Turicimonas muris]QQQ96015.1 phosphoribosyl-AMP cyclohydrolase [Turicimonas muris]